MKIFRRLLNCESVFWRLSRRTVATRKQCWPIRNIGLVAHIDAGKTTTTERMLYYSGVTHQMGEVHDGDTVMDYMQQERERGITITMASATINWLKHRINLLDTPGHVDFTFEVERSLSVLDGAVVILDASAGVQAQTIKVWQQANRYNLPRLIYLNKMDKPAASIGQCLASIEHRLSSTPLQLHLPLYDHSGQFAGLIDIPTGNCYRWISDLHESNEGKSFLFQPLLPNNNGDCKLEPFLDLETEKQYREQLSSAREQLIGQLCDLDSQFADTILSLDSIENLPPALLRKTIRNVCLNRLAFPVLVGSSYKKIGVQPLLDSVINYLPNPMESFRSTEIYTAYNRTVMKAEENLCALAFKITHDKRLGALTYLRIYSGTLTPGQVVYNLNREISEKITKVYRPFADHFADIGAMDRFEPNDATVTVGDIVVVSGLASTITGDTLIFASHSKDFTPTYAGIQVPDPVYYCSLESPSLSKMKQLELALEQLQREDPSFKVTSDQSTNQFVIKGMGELHIDILKERIKQEYGVDVSCGRLQVSYHESIKTNAREALEIGKSVGGVNNFVKVNLEVFPVEDVANAKIAIHPKEIRVQIVNTKEVNLSGQIKPHHLKWIQMGIFKALEYGPLFSFPVAGVAANLYDFSTTNRTTQAFVVNSVAQCTLAALRQANSILLEPIMKLEISTPEVHVGSILSDLSGRRCEFGDEQHSTVVGGDRVRNLVAFVPLSELENYSTVLRSISSGMANFEMHLVNYRPMDEQLTNLKIRSISGVD